MHTIRNALAGATLALAATLAGATTLAGNLGDAGNAALVGSDLGAPDFTDDNAVANNVALYTFTTYAGTVSIVSTGFAGGGVDPYFTLFSGSGATAVFYDSNYTQAFDTGGDFTWTGTLAAGTYEIALGSFANMSFAEQYPPGTYLLGDGFTMLGDPNALHDGSYSLTLTTVVPEPSSTWLLAVGLGALVATRARRDRRA
jgi:hypothetical protein